MGHAGTAPYMSPEMVQNLHYGTATDVWSLGVLAYLLFLGEFPYEPVPPQPAVVPPLLMKNAIAQNSPAPKFEPTHAFPKPSPDVTAFLREILVRDPESRLTAEEILLTPLMRKTAVGDSAFSPRTNTSIMISSLLPTISPGESIDSADRDALDVTLSERNAPRASSCMGTLLPHTSSMKEGASAEWNTDIPTLLAAKSRHTMSNSHVGEINIAVSHDLAKHLR